MKNREIQSEICEKKQLLDQEDHLCNKLLEALVYGPKEVFEERKERYRTIMENREAWRNRLSELETMDPEPDDEENA